MTCCGSTPPSARRRRSQRRRGTRRSSRLLRWYLDTARGRRRHGRRRTATGCPRERPRRLTAAELRQRGRGPGLVRRRAGQHRRRHPPGRRGRPARDRLAAAADAVPAVQPAEQLGRLRDHPPDRASRARARPATGPARPGRSTSSASRWPGCGTRRPSATLSRRSRSAASSATRGERRRPRIALGEGYLNMHGPGEDALRYMRHAVDLPSRSGATSLLAIALNNLGEVYFGLGDLHAAAECYRKPARFAGKSADTPRGTRCTISAGFTSRSTVWTTRSPTTGSAAASTGCGDLWARRRRSSTWARCRRQPATTWPGRASLSRALRIFEQIGERGRGGRDSGPARRAGAGRAPAGNAWH